MELAKRIFAQGRLVMLEAQDINIVLICTAEGLRGRKTTGSARFLPFQSGRNVRLIGASCRGAIDVAETTFLAARCY